ncbi:hypothetical protein HQ496_06190 [bacterium]|nr:hypothetical protein [bacterium]
MPGKKHLAHPPQNAVLCIDYANVFGVISQHTDNDQPDAVVLDLVRDLQRHVLKEMNLKTIRTLGFASLPPNHVTGHRATGAWLAAGIEPRFSYARSTDEASAIDMAMESIEISRSAGKETAFILLSGNQWFIPLVQRLQRTGHQVVMATLESPLHSDHLPEDCKEAFMNAQFLLSGNGKRFNSDPKSSRVQDSPELEEAKRPEEITLITDEVVKHTLQIIDSSFGQYEKIYLTPLLRKLSEIFEDSDDDPKALVNELEEAGAVWLEKRRGFPHNYTILMMNEDHPDVAELKEARLQNTDSGYDDDFYDDYSDSDGDTEEYQSDDDDQYPE